MDKKQVGAYIYKYLNVFIYISISIGIIVLFRAEHVMEGVILMMAVAIYMLAVKIDNVDKKISGR